MSKKSIMQTLQLGILLSLLLAVAACSAPQDPELPKFQQKIEVLGLPESVEANITVTGPNNFKAKVTKTIVLDKLEYGEYILTVKDVLGEQSYFFTGYSPSVPFYIASGSSQTVQVTYEPEAQLKVIIEGLPDGIKADVTLQQLNGNREPAGTGYTLTESTLVKGLKPGDYTFLAKDVKANQLFSAFPVFEESSAFRLESGSQNAEKINYAVNATVARTMVSINAVAMDGSVIAVSGLEPKAGREDCNLSFSCTGSVDILELKSDGSWTTIKTLAPTNDIAYDYNIFNSFGQSVAINGDTVAVGAPDADNQRGAVYIFKKDQGGVNNWGLYQTLELPWYNVTYPGRERFGWSLATQGNTLVAGALTDSIDTNGDGNYNCAFETQTSECNVGSVLIFQRSVASDYWGFAKKILPREPIQSSYFGEAIDVDGDTVVIGAKNGGRPANFGRAGVAYVYERNQGGQNNWGETAILSPNDAFLWANGFGRSVSIEKNIIAVGSPFDTSDVNLDGTIECKKAENENYQELEGSECGSGTVYVYQKNVNGQNGWNQTHTLSGTRYYGGPAFGYDVEVDGNSVVVGTPRQNLVYSFDLTVPNGKMYQAYFAKGNYNFGVKLTAQQGKIIAVASTYSNYDNFEFKNDSIYIVDSSDF